MNKYLVPTILLGNLYDGLPNELFNLSEKEDSKEGIREADEEKFQRTGEKEIRTNKEPESRAPREIRITTFAIWYCHISGVYIIFIYATIIIYSSR